MAAHVCSPTELAAARRGRTLLHHVDAQGGAAQGDRRRASPRRWPGSPSTPSGVRRSGPATGAPADPVWLRDLPPRPATGPRSPGSGTARPARCVEHDGTRAARGRSPPAERRSGRRGRARGRMDRWPEPRWVLHLDMDAFFASVEQLTRPTLRDRPVLVGGLGPRAVVAGASYQARVFGARSAMPMGQARRLCPHAVVLPPRFALYQALSERVMAVLAEAAPVVEPVSLDEAFLEPPDLAGAGRGGGRALRHRAAGRGARGHRAARLGRRRVRQAARQDRLRAGQAGRAAGGRPGDEQQAVLEPLPVRALWGVGPVAEAGAAPDRGADDRRAGRDGPARGSPACWAARCGAELHRLARGDRRPAGGPRGAAKQVSAETTFDADLTAMTAVHDAVARMTEAAHRRLVASGRAARTVTVKVRSADFTTSSRSETAGIASTDLGALTAVAQRLARAAVPEGGRAADRGVAGRAGRRPAARPVRAEPCRPRRRPGPRPHRRRRRPDAPAVPKRATRLAARRRRPSTRRTATAGCRAPGTAGSPCASRPAAPVPAGPVRSRVDDPSLTRADPLLSLA